MSKPQKYNRRASDRRRRVGTSIFERHLQTGIQFVLIALILWSGQTTLDLKDKIARLEEQFRGLQKDFSAASTDKYSATQATRDMEALASRMTNLERAIESQGEWVRSLRDRHIALEADVRSYGIQKRNDVNPPSGRR